jgi:hypothetical protein
MQGELPLGRVAQVVPTPGDRSRGHGAVPGVHEEAEVATPDAKDVAGLEGISHVRAPRLGSGRSSGGPTAPFPAVAAMI